jgi:hypothetical protein
LPSFFLDPTLALASSSFLALALGAPLGRGGGACRGEGAGHQTPFMASRSQFSALLFQWIVQQTRGAQKFSEGAPINTAFILLFVTFSVFEAQCSFIARDFDGCIRDSKAPDAEIRLLAGLKTRTGQLSVFLVLCRLQVKWSSLPPFTRRSTKL